MQWCKHLGGVQVSGVSHGGGVVAVVPVFDDGVKEFREHLGGTEDRVKCLFFFFKQYKILKSKNNFEPLIKIMLSVLDEGKYSFQGIYPVNQILTFVSNCNPTEEVKGLQCSLP